MAQFIYTLEKARKAHGDKVVIDNVTLNLPAGTGRVSLGVSLL